MDKAIAVFMFDGSDKYSAMTLHAIRSFLTSSPTLHAGVLVPPTLKPESQAHLEKELKDLLPRIDIRRWTSHFVAWNPTQHKLDVQLYSDKFEIILWVDSDTITFSDVKPIVDEFSRSSAIVGLVEDLVCSKPNFQARWAAATGSYNPSPFVPQCAFMMFKRPAFQRLFPTWKAVWQKWIEPAPFAYYGDPDPAFQGSAFCIEQYALGLALEQLNMLTDGSLYRIQRRQIIFKDVGPNGTPGQLEAYRIPFSALFGSVNTDPAISHPNPGYIASSGQLNGSYSMGSSFGGVLAAFSSLQLTSGQLGSYQLGSGQLAGLLGSQQLGSGQVVGLLGSQQVGSYQLGSFQLGSYQLGSFQLGSGQLSSGGSFHLSSAALAPYQLGSSQFGSHHGGTPAGGSYALGGLPENLRLHEALQNQASVLVVGVRGGGHDVVVDSFGGAMLHFYSSNYDSAAHIYKENQHHVHDALVRVARTPAKTD